MSTEMDVRQTLLFFGLALTYNSCAFLHTDQMILFQTKVKVRDILYILALTWMQRTYGIYLETEHFFSLMFIIFQKNA